MRLINFIFLYILVPAVIILLSIKFANGYGLFGLLFYAAGIIIAQFKMWIFLPIPLIFAFWYWYTYGMGPADYVFIYTLCLLAGVGITEVSKWYHRFVHKVLPEQITNIDYNEKVDELNRRLEKYRLEHPNEKLTSDVVEKIRTDVFFQ